MGADALVETYDLHDLPVPRPDLEPTNLTELFRQAQAASLVATAVRDRRGMPRDEGILRFNHAGIEYVARATQQRSGRRPRHACVIKGLLRIADLCASPESQTAPLPSPQDAHAARGEEAVRRFLVAKPASCTTFRRWWATR